MMKANRREKPHKKIISKMKEDYADARTERFYRDLTKEQEVELAYLQHEIETRGFRFFADHYIQDTLDEYVSIINNAPLKKKAA